MHYIGINGSPRKNMNTSKLLHAAIEELEKHGKQTKIYHLYDLNFKGCYSCFSCKKEKGNSYGKCIINDDLKDLFEEIKKAEGLILASPIYYRDVTGEMKSFLERLLFQNMVYSKPPRTLVKEKIKVGLIYTMNIDEALFNQSSLKGHLETMEGSLKMIFGETKAFFSFSTNQLNSYEGIEYTYFNPEERLRNHEINFPKELVRVRQFAENSSRGKNLTIASN